MKFKMKEGFSRCYICDEEGVNMRRDHGAPICEDCELIFLDAAGEEVFSDPVPSSYQPTHYKETEDDLPF